jgi:esterase/lipase
MCAHLNGSEPTGDGLVGSRSDGSLLRPFAGPEHQPFLLEGNRNVALLVHGFPGTANELRTVGEMLHAGGWSVEGMLLPGFGPEFGALGEQSAEGWRRAVLDRAVDLRMRYDRLLLVGNSMGAALALLAAADVAVDGLILFAPYWRVNNRLIEALAPVAFRAVPKIRPFRKADFSDPRTVEMLERVLPDADLNDSAVQAQLRDFVFPLGILSEARLVGQRGFAAAKGVQAPVLIMQGASDPLAHQSLTTQLAQRLPNLAGLVVVDSGHELAHINNGAEEAIAPLLRAFAASLVEPAHSVVTDAFTIPSAAMEGPSP